jgi:hypothetical protein
LRKKALPINLSCHDALAQNFRNFSGEKAMNWRRITILLSASAIATTSITLSPKVVQAESRVQFVCSQSFNRNDGRRYPTTVAWTKRGKVAIIQWTKAWTNKITAQQRCEEVSSRFEQAYNKGTLNFITNGTMNGQRVICTTSESGRACETLLMTLRSEDLRPKDKSLTILNTLKDLLNGRLTQQPPIQHSSGVPQIYYEVDMEQFLQESPVMEE